MVEGVCGMGKDWLIVLHVDGLRPRASPRARAGMRGVFLPPEYQDFKRSIREQVSSQGCRMLEGWLEMEITCIWERPKKPKHPFPPVCDWDNLGKTMCDALIGLCFEDDRFVVDGRCRKAYGARDGYIVRIRRCDPPTDGRDWES